MRDLLILLVHLITTTARLMGPGPKGPSTELVTAIVEMMLFRSARDLEAKPKTLLQECL